MGGETSDSPQKRCLRVSLLAPFVLADQKGTSISMSSLPQNKHMRALVIALPVLAHHRHAMTRDLVQMSFLMLSKLHLVKFLRVPRIAPSDLLDQSDSLA